MPTKDLHAQPFTEETITKLEIFEDYAEAWIPTFVMSQWYKKLNIFDFFAGTGYDKQGIEGSPIRILKQVENQIGNIFKKNKIINVYINEYDAEKYNLLVSSCNNYINSHSELKRCLHSHHLNIIYTNKCFEELFFEYYEYIKADPSLVYIDQNGVKFLADEYFLKLVDCTHVDFLYFVSSSFFYRFGETEEFKKILDINMDKAKKNPYKYIHQYILEVLKEKIPDNNNTRLYPFTLKKGTNIYGIIFGASHLRAVDKFLTIAWEKNEVNGVANFDIDDDLSKDTMPDLFGKIELTKIAKFKRDIKEKILNRILKSNKDVYLYSLENGHIPKHSVEIVKQMKKEGLISYNDKSPLINYNKAIKEKNIISYQVL